MFRYSGIYLTIDFRLTNANVKNIGKSWETSKWSDFMNIPKIVRLYVCAWRGAAGSEARRYWSPSSRLLSVVLLFWRRRAECGAAEAGRGFAVVVVVNAFTVRLVLEWKRWRGVCWRWHFLSFALTWIDWNLLACSCSAVWLLLLNQTCIIALDFARYTDC